MCNVAEAVRSGRTDVRTEQVRRELERLFPGVIAWFGRCTGHWWAMLGDRLLEADSPRQLADEIRAGLAVRPAGCAVIPQAGRADVPSTMGVSGRGGRGRYVR